MTNHAVLIMLIMINVVLIILRIPELKSNNKAVKGKAKIAVTIAVVAILCVIIGFA